jgi:hypothetical protein
MNMTPRDIHGPYKRTLRLVNVKTNIYFGDYDNGKVYPILGAGQKISGWDSSYERAALFTQEEVFDLARNMPDFAIVGLNPGVR